MQAGLTSGLVIIQRNHLTTWPMNGSAIVNSRGEPDRGRESQRESEKERKREGERERERDKEKERERDKIVR